MLLLAYIVAGVSFCALIVATGYGMIQFIWILLDPRQQDYLKKQWGNRFGDD